MGKFGAAALGLGRELDLDRLGDCFRFPFFFRFGLFFFLLSAFAFPSLPLPALFLDIDSLFAKRFDRTNERNAISAPSWSSFHAPDDTDADALVGES